jgi:tetratricopeptide (TPR) repeat protein
MFTLPMPSRRFRNPLRRWAATALTAGSIAMMALPAWAGDPFRSTNAHPIDNQTEAAFRAIFERGHYQEAAQILQSPNPNEPLAYAMRASLAYLNEDMNALGENATLTREAAEQLVASDPLRGHLYTAVGYFLEGAHTISTEPAVRATPIVLGKLQQVFDNLEEAERIDPNDSELNLLKGYMDLMLAVNLPFSSPQQAIERLQTHAAPSYLAQRGIAVGYRDLNQQEQALAAVDRALQETPNNPDLLYLKAQILTRQSNHQASLRFYRRALAQQNQLPRSLVIQISFEECRTQNRVNRRQRNCDAERDAQREQASRPVRAGRSS